MGIHVCDIDEYTCDVVCIDLCALCTANLLPTMTTTRNIDSKAVLIIFLLFEFFKFRLFYMMVLFVALLI